MSSMNYEFLSGLSDETLVCSLALQSAITAQEYDSIAGVLEKIQQSVLHVSAEKRLESSENQEKLDNLYYELENRERDIEYAKEEWTREQRQAIEEEVKKFEEGFSYKRPTNCC